MSVQNIIQHNINQCGIDYNPYTRNIYNPKLMYNIHYIDKLDNSKCITLETLFNQTYKYKNKHSKDLGYGYTIQNNDAYMKSNIERFTDSPNNTVSESNFGVVLLMALYVYIIINICGYHIYE